MSRLRSEPDGNCRRLQIVVDHRERASGVPDVLGSLDTVELRFAELETGDYLIDDQLVVERKTVEDFAKSIVDTRLFRQASRLRHVTEQRPPARSDPRSLGEPDR